MRSLLSDGWAVVAIIDPDNYATSPVAGVTTLSDEIDMSLWSQLAAFVVVGDVANPADTVDFKFTQASASGGTYKDVTSAAMTQLTGSPDDSNKQAIIEIDQTALDMDNDYRYVKGSLTTAGGGTAPAVDACVVILGRAKYGPASDNDLASVAEIANY